VVVTTASSGARVAGMLGCVGKLYWQKATIVVKWGSARVVALQCRQVKWQHCCRC